MSLNCCGRFLCAVCARACVCVYDVGTWRLGFKELISHIILSVRAKVLLLLGEAHGVLSLFVSFRLECCFLRNVSPSSTSTSFRIPYQRVHFWPFVTFLTLYLATFNFLLWFCLYEKRVYRSGDVEDYDLLVCYSEWQSCWFPKFRKTVPPSSSTVKDSLKTRAVYFFVTSSSVAQLRNVTSQATRISKPKCFLCIRLDSTRLNASFSYHNDLECKYSSWEE